MSLHYTLACDSPASRRLRRCAPLLLVVGLTTLALAPGIISGDRPFQTSLCGYPEQALEACTQLRRTGSSAMHERAAELVEPAPPVP
jgi:peptidoglycan/LPS O-acetylase OafA/YrhL